MSVRIHRSEYAKQSLCFPRASSKKPKRDRTVESHFSKGAKGGAPSITVSALSRDTSTDRRFFLFPLVEGFGFGVALGVAFALCSCDQGPLSESCGGSLVPPTIYPVTDVRP